MLYERFLENIHDAVQEKLGPEYNVTLHQVLKNNGSFLDGLSIRSSDSALSPTIYLNSYYEEAETGLSLPVIAEQICLLYEEQPLLPEEEFCHIDNFSSMKDRIVFKLVNTKDNQLLLMDVPHYPFLDLTIIFYLILSESSDGQMTTIVRNEHLTRWNISREMLLSLAEENTPRLFPPQILPIERVLADIGCPPTCHTGDSSTSLSLSVLSNQNGINGAGCLLYKQVLKNFAEQEEDDIIILPSSIHEVLLTPVKKAFPYHELNEMVTLINNSEVPAEDRLSNHVYQYFREQDCIMIPNPISPVTGTPPLQ